MIHVDFHIDIFNQVKFCSLGTDTGFNNSVSLIRGASAFFILKTIVITIQTVQMKDIFVEIMFVLSSKADRLS